MPNYATERWHNFVRVRGGSNLRDLGVEWAAMSDSDKNGFLADANVQAPRTIAAARLPLPVPSSRTPFGLGTDDFVISLEELGHVEFGAGLISSSTQVLHSECIVHSACLCLCFCGRGGACIDARAVVCACKFAWACILV